ncbi:MAG: YlcI/YnfO family protein [Bacilli bacterium]
MAFQIRPNRKETENKTIRFPIPLLEKIDIAIKDNNVSFSKFVIQACEYALSNMDDVKEISNKKNSK